MTVETGVSWVPCNLERLSSGDATVVVLSSCVTEVVWSKNFRMSVGSQNRFDSIIHFIFNDFIISDRTSSRFQKNSKLPVTLIWTEGPCNNK